MPNLFRTAVLRGGSSGGGGAPEHVQDGSFTTGAGWTTAGGATITGGELVFGAGPASRGVTTSLVALQDVNYRVECDLRNTATTNLNITIGPAASTTIAPNGSPAGHYSVTAPGNSTGQLITITTGSAGSGMRIDNLTVKVA